MRQLVRTVVITGASAGLGEALALLYAAEGRTLGLLGRNCDRLALVAARCRERGAEARVGSLDVTGPEALGRWIGSFDAAHPIDLLIVNAGAFTGNGPAGAAETVDEIAWLLRTNLEGATNTIAAALQPLADAPAYSASKAGLMSYGEALREWLLPDNVAVTLIYPGHIKTAQVAHHVGALPLMVSAETAARRIKRGLDAGRSFIAFPRRLLWLIRAGRLLPWPLRAWFGRTMRFHVAKYR